MHVIEITDTRLHPEAPTPCVTFIVFDCTGPLINGHKPVHGWMGKMRGGPDCASRGASVAFKSLRVVS